MSHKATAWLSTIPADALGHSEFRILFHLCDCHNPSQGCFPTQAYLVKACGVASSTLNVGLSNLEAKGLIRRHQTTDETTKRQRPTRYILGFEIPEEQEPTPISGVGADSDFRREPTPIFGESRLRFSERADSGGPESIEEPVSLTSKRTSKDLFGSDEPQSPRDALPASEAKAENTGSGFTEFWEAYPKAPRKTDKPKAKASFDRIVAGKAKGIGSVRPETIIAAVKRYAASGPDPEFVPLPTTWLNGARWEQWAEAPKPKLAAYRSPSDWMNEAARRDPCPDHGRFA